MRRTQYPSNFPPSGPPNLNVWCAQAEAQFQLRADETMYYYVVSALDQSTATRPISAPPTDNKYKAVKDRLLDTFSLSRREQASRLLHVRPLGDSKPSALMDEMLGDPTISLIRFIDLSGLDFVCRGPDNGVSTVA